MLMRWLGLAHAEHENDDGDQRRGHREPQHGANVVAEEGHEPDRGQWPHHGADGVERLAEAERRTSAGGRRDIGNEGIAWRTANALADAIGKAGEQHEPDRARQRKQRLGHGGETIAGNRQRLALAENIGQPAGENAADLRRRLGNSFHKAEHRGRRAEIEHEEQWQKPMDQLGGDVHEQRGEAERPDRGRQALHFCRVRCHGRHLQHCLLHRHCYMALRAIWHCEPYCSPASNRLLSGRRSCSPFRPTIPSAPSCPTP